MFVEPVPYCMERLRSNYDGDQRFAFEEVAIGPEEAIRPFFYLSDQAKRAHPNLPDWYDQLGSFEKGHIEKHFGAKLSEFIVEGNVEVVRLQSVLNRNQIERIDFLQIDTEGYDLSVLKTLDFETILPRVILVEHKHLSRATKAELKSLLATKGYRIQNLGHDYLATRDN